MAASPGVLEQNQKLAEQINAEALANPQSTYSRKFVGIANGQVVVVADNLDDVDDALEKAEPDPDKTFFFEAGIDYDQVQHIWDIPSPRDLAASRASAF